MRGGENGRFEWGIKRIFRSIRIKQSGPQVSNLNFKLHVGNYRHYYPFCFHHVLEERIDCYHPSKNVI